jgi:ArsR family transcriptional regulator
MNIDPEHVFRMLCDPIRLRCVLLIRQESSLCVCELTHALDLEQPKISRHLARLRRGKLVLDERRGQWVHYRLHPDLPDWVLTVIDAARTGQRATQYQQDDRQRLAAMLDRPERCA